MATQNRINLKELTKSIRAHLATHHNTHEIPLVMIEKILDSTSNIILHSLQTGKEISWSGVGAFVIQKRKATVRRNPQNGQEIKIPSKEVVKMRLFKSFAQKCALKPTKGKR
jgi:nucleoid DNA-binding protein